MEVRIYEGFLWACYVLEGSIFVNVTSQFNAFISRCRACIDTSEVGNLEAGVCLGEYSVTREYAPLIPEDQLNISINIHDDGNTLEIVSLCCKCK